MRIFSMKLVKYPLSLIIILVLFYFMARQLYYEWDELSNYKIEFNYRMLFLSLIPLISNFLINTIYFQHLLKILGVPINSISTFKVLYLSHLGKYIPGGIWPILGQFYLFEKERVSKVTIFIANVTLILLDTISVFMVFIPFYLLYFYKQTKHLDILLLIIIICCVLLLNPKIFTRIVTLVNFRLKGENINLKYRYYDLIYLSLLGVLDWLILGIGLYFLISSFHNIPVKLVPYLSGAFALSWIIGTYSFIVPNGLGVREGILSYLLSFFLPIPISIILSILARLWITGGDLISSLLAFLIKVRQDKDSSFRLINFVRRVI